MKYDIVVGGKGDKHMAEYEHFNQERAVQYCAEWYILCPRRINNTLSPFLKEITTQTKTKWHVRIWMIHEAYNIGF